jgi:plastocyanin
VRAWRSAFSAALFATLLLIPIDSGAKPPAASADSTVTNSFSDGTSAAPIWIVKMNDDDPMYAPSTVRIVAGQSVEWQNNGQVSHSVTDDPARANKPDDALLPTGVKPFNSGNVMPGGRFRHTFTQPGRYRYFCLTHEGDRMVGEVIVEPFSLPPRVTIAKSTRAITPSEIDTSAPVQIIKMNDDEPMYQPSSIQIDVGQTVEWQNAGQVSHSVTDDPARATNPVDALRPAGSRPFNSGSIMPGSRFRHTFTKSGRYRYFCLSHEMDRMIGEVIVAPAQKREAPVNSRSATGLSVAARRAMTE